MSLRRDLKLICRTYAFGLTSVSIALTAILWGFLPTEIALAIVGGLSAGFMGWNPFVVMVGESIIVATCIWVTLAIALLRYRGTFT